MPMGKITTHPSLVNRNRLLEFLRESPAQLKDLSRSLPEEQLCERLAEKEWPLKEHLAHMLSRKEITSQSIYYALLVNDPILPDIHP
jgi:hypothetical protein